jgi:tetratricopeptide (TPR) repeat protein
MSDSATIKNVYYWWMNELSAPERYLLNHIYRPMGSSIDEMTADNTIVGYLKLGNNFSSASPVSFLSGLAHYLDNYGQFELKLKILKKAEETSKFYSFIDKHFLYLTFVQVYKALSTNNPKLLTSYFFYCHKMVEIADEVKDEMQKENFLPLPAHLGYEGIFEELKASGRFDEAVRLVARGRENGWGIQYLINEAHELVKEHGLNAKSLGLKDGNSYYTEIEIQSDPHLQVTLLLERLKNNFEISKEFGSEAEKILDVIDRKQINNYAAVNAFYEIGSIYYKQGLTEKALMFFNKISSKTSLSNVTLSKFYGQIGKLFNEGGEFDLAILWLRRGLELNSKLGVKTLLNRLTERTSVPARMNRSDGRRPPVPVRTGNKS